MISYCSLSLRKSLLIFFFIVCISNTFSQTIEPLTVTMQSINIPGIMVVGLWARDHPNQPYPNYPKLVYGFAEGDEIIIDFSTENKNGTQLLEIREYESKSIIYSNNKFQTLEDVRFRIPKKGVYQFEFATNHSFDRQCKVTLRRIPASEANRNFNCNVVWQDVNDTTFTMVEEKVKIGSKYQTYILQAPSSQYINSWSNDVLLGGKSRIGFPITLPANTVEWYYTFSANRQDNEVASTKKSMSLLADLTKLVDQTGVLAFGVGALTSPPEVDYCDVYVMNQDMVSNFLNKEDSKWKYILECSRQNLKSGVVKVSNCCTSGTYYIGFENPNNLYGINVFIEVVAVTEQPIYEIQKVKKMVSIKTSKIAVYGN